MRVKESDSNKRNNERIDLSFAISLPGQDGKTKNISVSGVYFEIITDDTEAFAPGTIIPIQITATKIKLNNSKSLKNLTKSSQITPTSHKIPLIHQKSYKIAPKSRKIK